MFLPHFPPKVNISEIDKDIKWIKKSLVSCNECGGVGPSPFSHWPIFDIVSPRNLHASNFGK